METEVIPQWATTYRCDHCSISRATSAFLKEDKILYFCGHHTRGNELVLIADSWLKVLL